MFFFIFYFFIYLFTFWGVGVGGGDGVYFNFIFIFFFFFLVKCIYFVKYNPFLLAMIQASNFTPNYDGFLLKPFNFFQIIICKCTNTTDCYCSIYHLVKVMRLDKITDIIIAFSVWNLKMARRNTSTSCWYEIWVCQIGHEFFLLTISAETPQNG